MNKSFALKKKFYLFSSLVLFTFLFLYLTYFLINGQKSFVSYFKLKNQKIEYQTKLNILKNENDYFLDRIKRLQTNTIDLDFLDQQFRENTGIVFENEVLIILE